MPIITLRSRNDPDELDPLAAFRVLAVMIAPSNERERCRLLARIEKGTGINPTLRPRLSNDEVWNLVTARAPKGSLAGDLVLYMIQAKREFGKTSLNLAVNIVKEAVPRWEQPVGDEWHRKRHEGRLNRDRQAILRAFKRYRSAAHLWAAYVVVQSEGLTDLEPHSNESLPHFLAIAEAIAAEAAAIYLQRAIRAGSRRKERLLIKSSIWRFDLPPGAQQRLNIGVPRLTPAAREIALRHFA